MRCRRAHEAAPRGVRARRRRSRLGLFLSPRRIVVLAVVIGYPVVRAVVMSFQKDAGPRPGDRAVRRGRLRRLLQLHPLAVPAVHGGGPSRARPARWARSSGPPSGTPSFFTVVTVALEVVLGLWMALVMGRAVQGPRAAAGRGPDPVGDPDRGHRQAVVLHLRLRRHRQPPARHRDPVDRTQWPARFAVIIADVWKTTPFIALLILAGLQMIPAGRLRGGQGRRRHRVAAVHRRSRCRW